MPPPPALDATRVSRHATVINRSKTLARFGRPRAGVRAIAITLKEPTITPEPTSYESCEHSLSLLLGASLAGTALAGEGHIPNGMPRMDHIFVIMMENHSAKQIVGNPAMPFINSSINGKANVANNYFAVGHPSLTNYLEIVGGSNFSVRSDNSPDWHNTGCLPNIHTGITNADNDSGNAPYPIESGNVCPIAGTGTDTVTEAVDNWNETTPPVFNFLANIDGVQSIPAAKNTAARPSADQRRALGCHGRPTRRICRSPAPTDQQQQRHGVKPDHVRYDQARIGNQFAAPVECRRVPTGRSDTALSGAAASLRGEAQSFCLLPERARRRSAAQQCAQHGRLRWR